VVTHTHHARLWSTTPVIVARPCITVGTGGHDLVMLDSTGGVGSAGLSPRRSRDADVMVTITTANAG
jgi:hypothetical protein